MGSACDLRSYQCIFRVECIRIYLFQRIPSVIVVAISGTSGKMFCTDTVFLHGMQYFQLIVLCIFIDRIKTCL